MWKKVRRMTIEQKINNICNTVIQDNKPESIIVLLNEEVTAISYIQSYEHNCTTFLSNSYVENLMPNVTIRRQGLWEVKLNAVIRMGP